MHMDPVERIRQLIELMKENELTELEVEEPDLKIRLRRAEQYAPEQSLPQPRTPAGLIAPQEEAKDEELAEIASPMVGTFYRASDPASDPFVSVGSFVESDTVVCIIEAMKVMNEIKAEVTGRIVEVLVENAHPVEYGQPLFLVEPA